MKILSSLASLYQIPGWPLCPMLRGIVVRVVDHFHVDPEGDGYSVLI